MFKKITIIGLGLMGGSLAAACRKRFPKSTIVGVTRSRKALAFALRKKWLNEGAEDVARGASGADLVILCTPVDAHLPILGKVDRVVKPGALVMDVGSVKGSIHRDINRVSWKRMSFVGAHPMVGSHERGIDAATPGLYENGIVFLTRDDKTSPKIFRVAKRFWEKLSAQVVTLSPDLHDSLVGEISHLPHAVAACLVHTVSERSLPSAARGFRDTTRIAASDPSVWLPIFRANKKNVLSGLRCFEREIRYFKKLLRSDEVNPLRRYLEKAQKIRQSF
ncbi:MAG: prephenate dehydrogenase [Candidatus Omnitrophica bacterium ADurb.Bin277]|nr:MAG: prephenate dehydrogenase [Candidatus Omnitrophica bacterium ADurb.Bin277]